jgi:hypothetical protein
MLVKPKEFSLWSLLGCIFSCGICQLIGHTSCQPRFDRRWTFQAGVIVPWTFSDRVLRNITKVQTTVHCWNSPRVRRTNEALNSVLDLRFVGSEWLSSLLPSRSPGPTPLRKNPHLAWHHNAEGSVADWLYCTPFLSQPMKPKTVWVLVSETLANSHKWFTWPLHLSKCRKVGCK